MCIVFTVLTTSPTDLKNAIQFSCYQSQYLIEERNLEKSDNCKETIKKIEIYQHSEITTVNNLI